MEMDTTEAKKPKVHRVMCEELKRVVNRITEIIPSIESARPGCNSGIQALCALYRTIDKANSQLKNCAESSKLYLAIRGESILLTFEKISRELDICLSKIQDMVPQPLAAEISDVIDDLRDSTFVVDSSEKEAGRILVSLLEQDKSANDSTRISESEAFQIAALQLKITSQRSVLIERRSIKKQLDKVSDRENQKKNVLINLFHLLRKYGNLLGCEPAEAVHSQQVHSAPSNTSAINNSPPETPAQLQFHGDSDLNEPTIEECSSDGPPEELQCPISSELMFDPVVIASGETYERIWIEKWFSEGHDTCPKTLKMLPHLSLTPNSCVKELIANWCRKHNHTVPDPCSELLPASCAPDDTLCSTSIDNFGASLENVENRAFKVKGGDCSSQNDINNAMTCCSDCSAILGPSVAGTANSFKDGQIKISSWSNDSERCQSFEDLSPGKYSNFLSELATLPLESHCKALEDVKVALRGSEEAPYCLNSDGLVQALLAFFMNARNRSDIKAQKIVAQILLAFLSDSRIDVPSLNEDAYLLLASFLDSELFEEALEIMQLASSHSYCEFEIVASGVLPSIIKVLDSQAKEFLLQAVKILCNLSSYSSIKSHIVSSGCISKLIPLLGNDELAGDCLGILRNLCDAEEARVAIAETKGCIASLVELTDVGTCEEQENAVSVLLSLCSNKSDYCQLVMHEEGVPPLVALSINGSAEGRKKAMKLLLLFRDLSDSIKSSFSQAGCDPDLLRKAGSLCQEKQPASSVFNVYKRIRHFLKELIFKTSFEKQ